MTVTRITIMMVMICVRTTTTEPCLPSQQTVSTVASCPKNKEEWQQRSQLKVCSKQNCTGESVYHCAMNSFANETLEVCAPSVGIIGHSCVEYNFLGAVIQESPYVKCQRSCPFSYNSTEVYKYQECYQSIKSGKGHRVAQKQRNSAEKNWKITAIVFIVTTYLSCAYIIWMTIINPRREIRKNKGQYLYRKEENDKEEKLLGGEHDDKQIETEDESRMKRKMKDWKANERIGKFMQGTKSGGFNVAGIDIGDSFLTMALSKAEYPEDIILLGSFERISLLLNKKKESLAFGDEAYRLFMENKNDDLRYEDGFKLSDEKIEEEIYAEAITQILIHLHNALDKELSKELQSQVHYVFVVPTYWNKGAQERLREEILHNKNAKQYNIDNEHLRIIPRERTLSPFIHEVNARVLCLKFNVDNLILNREISNYSYAILHIGSTYCDLTFLKVEKDRDTDSLPYVKRHEWEVLPSQHLMCLLTKGYGNTIVDEWRKSHRKEYIHILYEFEKLHKMWTKKIDEKIAFTLDLPKGLSKIKDKVDAEIIDSKTKKLKIKQSFMKECFKEMKDQVKEWIISEKEAFKDVSCVVMTGTYSNMKMVWQRAEEKWFKGMPVTIAVPENIHVFAMGGAYYAQKDMAMKTSEATLKQP